MNKHLKTVLVTFVIVLGILLAIGLVTEPRSAFGQVIGEPWCYNQGCHPVAYLATILR